MAELMRPDGSARVHQWFEAQDEATLFISILTLAEYDKGIANLRDDDPRRDGSRAARAELVDMFPARILPVSNAIVLRWGVMSGTIRRDRGHAPQVVDTLLAATALEHDLCLVTRNTRDVRHSGATVFNPWDDDAPTRYRPSRSEPPI